MRPTDGEEKCCRKNDRCTRFAWRAWPMTTAYRDAFRHFEDEIALVDSMIQAHARAHMTRQRSLDAWSEKSAEAL